MEVPSEDSFMLQTESIEESIIQVILSGAGVKEHTEITNLSWQQESCRNFFRVHNSHLDNLVTFTRVTRCNLVSLIAPKSIVVISPIQKKGKS